MSEDREKLKQLLLSEEIVQIEALRKLLEDQKQFTQKVSEVLDQATDLTIRNNPKFQKKFSKIDSKAFSKAIKANKQTFIDALLPIIGPMIRQSVTQAIRRFVADVNRALEMGFSLKALKWRWQAVSTGVPFAELVFNNTIKYQVQQIFLIDNETGLLIEHAGQEEALLQDKEAMSAMLTAIQDFVKDSIDKESGGLSAAELGDNLLWLIQGSHANLAVVIKGAPTNRLRETLTDACENIHIEFEKDINNQEVWNNNPELKLQLEHLLLTKTQSDEQSTSKSTKIWPWLLIMTGLLGWYMWKTHQNNKTQQQYLELLNNTPGFVLQKLTHLGDNYVAKGLQDPMADLSQLPTDIIIQSTPFISLHDQMIERRVEHYLPFENIDVLVKNREITLSGIHPPEDSFKTKLANLTLLPGVGKIHNQLEVQKTIEQKFSLFLQQNPPPANIQINLQQQQLHISGQVMASIANPYLEQLHRTFDSIDSSQLQIFSTEVLKQKIANTMLPMISPASLDATQTTIIDEVLKDFDLLNSENNGLKLKIIPHSDCQGALERSNNYIRNRAILVQQALIESGLPEERTVLEIKLCEQVSDRVNYDLLGVWFEVVE